ncbi:hypothetical protein ABN763_13650 [Spongiivirga sp. MCCC 1A20706]|uniref:hypothetical protein n=1 Tax=Spongiivirga sp. MCCC 1A20706 TaxID=3160963 RepID=UPI00397792BB
MDITFKAILSYRIKIAGVILLTAVGFFFINLGIASLNFIFQPQIIILLNIIATVSGVITVFYLFNKKIPTIQLSEKSISINNVHRNFGEIKSFSPSKGGSEPFLILNNGKRIDLELSWFSKEDKTIIAEYLDAIINNKK